ncbi:MAG TPA: ribosome recycling factor [Chloroflexota bacterium]|jgi:ribosome recycling factor|nr:ribosome recycling factor [Chloroflexota bacterium]HZU07769.1 ribosome recycling factor [Chloroflexota bacterium]
MIDQIYQTAERKMKRAVEALQHDLAAVRTGRASPALLERVQVDYYGTPTPLNALAAINVPEPRLLVIQPWDKKLLPAIEKAIQKSDLGLTPSSDGSVVRLVVPPLNEERRRELVKLVHKRVEEARVAIRNCRREAIDELRKAEREQHLSEDQVKRAQERLQKLTDSFIAQADDVGRRKESEVMEL